MSIGVPKMKTVALVASKFSRQLLATQTKVDSGEG